MKLAIMQPYIFPYIGYFQLLKSVDKFVVFDDVTFIKQGWINRNNLLIHGQRNSFTIPLQNASSNRLIKDIQIVKDEKWRTKFLQSIVHNYKKSFFFEETYDLVCEVINSGETFISKMIVQSLNILKLKFDLNVEIVESSQIYANQELKGEERILDICKQENATHYINPIGGIEIYSRERFQKNNIELSFLQTLPFSYQQFNNEFVPYLSIIDVLMFNSLDTIQDLLSKYKLL